MRNQFFAGVAMAAIAMPAAAYAQSTGTIDAEEENVIVVTAARATEGVKGLISPDSPKARTILTQEAIGKQAAGQSILNTINVVPGVNFTNNDPYGSSGGNIRIRGFDGARVSLTFDGVPLNDSGNYAIFSNQQLDPEIIEQVNVNQGTTDVDSPTASAAGGTVNYRTIVPTDDYGAFLQPSYGEYNYHRLFGILQSGTFTKFGTKMFAAISIARNDKFKGPGEIFKQQYNGRIYQPIGDNGDFISISGHYNQNRNNFYRNLTLLQAGLDFADNGNFDYDNNASCVRATFVRGTAQNESNGVLQPSTAVRGTTSVTNPLGLDTSCTNYTGLRINPSNTGNVRISSKFHIADNLILAIDPSFQYVLANGGGFTAFSESDRRLRGAVQTNAGADLSGDGDTLDTVAIYTPNTTQTRRYGLIASLRWEITDKQSVRIIYTYDRARHRQTGEFGFLDVNGNPQDVFAGNRGTKIFAADGAVLRGRDRLSIALLNQISGEYRGKFFDDALSLTLGIRAPFFQRDLNQYCYTFASNGNPYCSSEPVGTVPVATTVGNYIIPNNTVFTGAVPSNAVYAPFTARYKFDRILPNAGFTYKFDSHASVFGSFAQGFSSPRTDNLYRAQNVTVQPETTNNFDLGVRYSSRTYQLQLNGFYNSFKNRIVTSFDQLQGISVDRNVGKVEIKGVEASFDVQPFSWLYFHGFASYLDSKLKENIQVGVTTAGTGGATVSGQQILLLTAGKKLTETPEFQYGYRAEINYGPMSVGANFKHVGARFATDLNDLKVPGYSTYDADVRIDLKSLGLKQTYLQFNVINLFDTKYLGSISTQIATPTINAVNVGSITGISTLGTAIPGGANPTFAIGSPRTILGTLRIGF